MNNGKGNTNFSYFSYDQFNNDRETPPEEETVSEELPQLTSAVETVDATRNASRRLPTLNVSLHHRRVNHLGGGFSAPTPFLDSRRTDGSSSFTPAPSYLTPAPPYIDNSSRNAAHLFGSSSFTPAPTYVENTSSSGAGLFGSSSFTPAPPPHLENSSRSGAGLFGSSYFTPAPYSRSGAGLFGSSSFTPAPPPYLESRGIGAGSSSSAPPDASRAEEAVIQGMAKTEICHFWQSNRCTRGERCRFAHGDGELRQVTVRHPNFRTEWCETVRNGGVCPYYERCHFRHY